MISPGYAAPFIRILDPDDLILWDSRDPDLEMPENFGKFSGDRKTSLVLTEFEYVFDEDKPDECTIKLATTDPSDLSLKLFTVGVYVKVTWGYWDKVGILLRTPIKMFILDMKREYTETSIAITLTLSDTASELLREDTPKVVALKTTLAEIRKDIPESVGFNITYHTKENTHVYDHLTNTFTTVKPKEQFGLKSWPAIKKDQWSFVEEDLKQPYPREDQYQLFRDPKDFFPGSNLDRKTDVEESLKPEKQKAGTNGNWDNLIFSQKMDAVAAANFALSGTAIGPQATVLGIGASVLSTLFAPPGPPPQYFSPDERMKQIHNLHTQLDGIVNADGKNSEDETRLKVDTRGGDINVHNQNIWQKPYREYIYRGEPGDFLSFTFDTKNKYDPVPIKEVLAIDPKTGAIVNKQVYTALGLNQDKDTNESYDYPTPVQEIDAGKYEDVNAMYMTDVLEGKPRKAEYKQEYGYGQGVMGGQDQHGRYIQAVDHAWTRKTVGIPVVTLAKEAEKVIEHELRNAMAEQAQEKLLASARIIGDPHVMSGVCLLLNGLSERDNGSYYMTRVSHNLNPSSGYIMTCEGFNVNAKHNSGYFRTKRSEKEDVFKVVTNGVDLSKKVNVIIDVEYVQFKNATEWVIETKRYRKSLDDKSFWEFCNALAREYKKANKEIKQATMYRADKS